MRMPTGVLAGTVLTVLPLATGWAEPMLSLGLQRNLTGAWQVSTFGFSDELSLRARRD